MHVNVKLMSRGVVTGTLTIPHFKPMPDVLVYGDKVYRKTHVRESNEFTHYAEAFAYYVPEIVAGKEPGSPIPG